MQNQLVGVYQSRPGIGLRVRFCVATIVLLLGPAGCGGGGNDTGETAISSTTPIGLTATLSQDRSQVSGLRDITYTLRLRNDTSASIVVSAETGPYPSDLAPTARLEIIDDTGAPVYPSNIFPARPPRESVNVPLAPGQSISTSFPFSGIETMPNPLFPRAGNYRATARFTVSGTQTVVGPLKIKVR